MESTNLKERIELLRNDLYFLVGKYGTLSPKVLEKSKELDHVLNLYNRAAEGATQSRR